MTALTTQIVGRIAALRGGAESRPVIVAVDGAVAAGKSTFARRLGEALDAADLTTAIVSADGFLLPAKQLHAENLMARKGFPESFDRPAVAAFLAAVRQGEAPQAPRYSHEAYDVAAGGQSSVGDVVIFEGVNVLAADLAPLYDLRLYLDINEAQTRDRFLARFAATPFTPLRAEALAAWKPASGDLRAWGEAVWAAINGPNLDQHIRGGRDRADILVR